jgi:hypothetical protein
MMKNNHFTETNVIAAREKDIKMLRHFGTYDFIKGQTKFFVGLMTNGERHWKILAAARCDFG